MIKLENYMEFKKVLIILFFGFMFLSLGLRNYLGAGYGFGIAIMCIADLFYYYIILKKGYKK